MFEASEEVHKFEKTGLTYFLYFMDSRGTGYGKNVEPWTVVGGNPARVIKRGELRGESLELRV